MTKRIVPLATGAAIFLLGANSFAAVGRTPGQFTVDSMGAANYSIPIWAPPGPRGIQPNVSLNYNSRVGIGKMGVGWSVGGLGAIIRCNLTYAQDAAPAPVALATTDGYCLNGSRLRLTSSGNYGAAGSTYQTEIADFSNITAYSTSGVTGIGYFIVQGRDGLKYYYGYTDANGNGANSEVPATGTTTAGAWLLSKVIDRSGNNYVINYTAETGTAIPHDIYWTPTTAGGSTYTYEMLFNYTTNVPQSSLTKYIGGTQVQNDQLLSNIQILLSGTVVKEYFLTYQLHGSPTTGRNELASVQECPSTTQSASACLAATNITYQGGGLGVGSTSTTALSSTGTQLTARYDLNGDGYPDVIYNNGTHWCVSFGSASGYGTAVSTGIPSSSTILVGNLNAGTKDGILAVDGTTWWYYTWNGTSFAGTSTGLAYDSTATEYELADINGDGLPDLVALYVTTHVVDGVTYTNATVDTRLNTTSGSTVSFSSTLTAAYLAGVVASAQLWTPDSQYTKLRHYDFDGDGRDDLVLVTITGTSPYYTYNTYELLATNTGFNPVLVSSVSASSYTPVFFTNWNDDACTDFVTTNSTTSSLYISGCNGTLPSAYTLTGKVVAAVDWDGDGRTDLAVANGSTIGVYLSTGGSPGTLLSTSIPYSSSCQYLTMDADADGLDDLGCWSTSGSLTYRLHESAGQPPDLLSSITDGYGNSSSPTYVPLTQNNYEENPSGGSSPTFPDRIFIGPMYVVSEAVFSDPSKVPGNTYNQTFEYYEGWLNLQGRGFEGFWCMRTVDSRYVSPNLLTRYQYFEQKFPWTGMEYTDLRSTGVFYPAEFVGTPNTLTQATLSGTANQERYFPYFTNSTTIRREVGGSENGDLITTTSTNYTFDNYGNATTIATTVTDNDPGSPYTGDEWTTTTTNTPDVDTTHWCLTLVTEQQVAYTASIGSAVTRTKTFTPDTTNCRYTQIVTEPTANGGLYKVTEALGFDSFGNISTDTMTGATMPSSPASRETQFNWGTTGQFLNKFTDPSNAITTWTYTSAEALTFGVPDSMKDANSLTTSWTYDAFGRKTKEARPDSTSTGWAWTLCTSYCSWSNSVYQIAQTSYETNGTTVIRTDTSSYDPIDRITQTAGPTVAATTATVQKLYNSLGLLSQQSMPFLSGKPVYQQTFLYDTLNRITSATRPISSTNSNPQSTTYGYVGRASTVTDPYGSNKTTVTDVNGWLRQAKDAQTPTPYTVTRAYDSAGGLTGITDSVGNTLLKNVTLVYGIKPFVTAATDADRGAWSYTVDSLGEKTSWTDAKGQSFSMTYDALSRPLTRTEPDLFTEWNYGSAAPNWGRLTSECTQSTSTTNLCTTSGSSWLYNEIRAYDGLARLSTRSITQSGNTGGNDGGGAFLYTQTYSATTGLVNTLTYPTSTSGFALTLQYGYGYGLLESITDTSDTVATCGNTCVLWAANATNGFGEVTQETLGNGVATTRTYDAVTSWLTGATAGSGNDVLNQSYLQDENGNVTQRQDNNLGLTESFFYDKDNRLTCATLGSSCSTPTFVYDGDSAGPGNITTQVGVGTYAYPAAGQPRPHAVTSITGTFNGITNPSFSYDANGNMTDRASSTANITWASYNYPIAISASDITGSEEVQFSYGPDRQRWKQIYTGPVGNKTTYYVGKELEVAFTGDTYYRHYIYAGSQPVAVYIRISTAVNTMNYLSLDHEGSISAITIIGGTVGVNESFAAFGARRDASSWSGPPSSSELNLIDPYTRQGYTFQTWLGESMGLNHMNGRVEDAISGRMLSPDPHVPDPTNSQSYNRYSYVINNPVTLIDPTGFSFNQNFKNCITICAGHWGGSGTGGGGDWGFGDAGSDFGGFSDIFGPSAGDYLDGSVVAYYGTFVTPAAPSSGDSTANATVVGGTSSATDGSANPADPAQSQVTVTAAAAQDQDQQSDEGTPSTPVTAQTASSAGSIDQLNQIVVQASRTGYLGGVPINFNLPFPQEQLWVVYPGNQIYYLGSNYGTKQGNVGANKVRLPPGFTDIIHTHPSWADSQPGPGDWGDPFPLYGISPNGVWLIYPGATSPSWLCGSPRGTCGP